jgi:hypothetical protein
MAEWMTNMAGRVRLIGGERKRRVIRSAQWAIEGGFVTAGAMVECPEVKMIEGWKAEDGAVHEYAVAALPDGHGMIVMERGVVGDRQTWLAEVKGLKLNVPNDLWNGFERTYHAESGARVVRSEEGRPSMIDLESPWTNVEDRIAVVGIYGGGGMYLFRPGERRGGPTGSLYFDELCSPCRVGTWDVPANSVVLDSASVVFSSVTAAWTRAYAAADKARRVEADSEEVRAALIEGHDGRTYLLAANFASNAVTAEILAGLDSANAATDLVTGEPLAVSAGVLRAEIDGGSARLFLIDTEA